MSFHSNNNSQKGLAPTSVSRRLVFLGIFLSSFSGLVLEVAITRIFSAAIWYHFAFVAVSVALVGLGASGLVVHYRLRKISENWAGNMTIAAALGVTLAIPLSLFVMHSLSSHVDYLPLYMGLFSIPFFFIGITISAAFNAFARTAGRLYASDLVGASAGGLLVVLALTVLGGEGTVLMVGLVSAASAVVFSISARDRKKIAISLAFVAFAASLIVLDQVVVVGGGGEGRLFSIPTDPNAQKDLPLFLKENPRASIVKTEWNSFSRIDVVEGPLTNCDNTFSDPNNNAGQQSSKCAYEGLVAKVFIDGGAGTNIVSWDGNPESRKDMSNWMQYKPFTMMQDPKVLVIGSGGGRDVVAALASGSKDVTSVEINPIIFNTVKEYGDRAGNVYTHPYVNANVDEGRSFVSRSTEKYDIVYIPFVDTWASVSSGGLGVSENFLYTQEAFQEYYDHLKDRGKVIAVRWLIDSPRFVSTFLTTLERNGVPQEEAYKHIMIVSAQSAKKDPSGTMAIMSKAPFTEQEIQYLYDFFVKEGYHPILVPGKVALEPHSSLLNGQITLQQYYDMFPTKAYAVTDDSPYFLSYEKPFPKVLEVLLYVSLGIAAVFMVGPYVWLRMTNRRSSNAFVKSNNNNGSSGILRTGSIALYFAAIGTGFILIELALLQKLVLLLGNPTMTFALLLFTLLISSGFGSLVSSRLTRGTSAKRLAMVIAGIASFGVAYLASLSPLIYSIVSEQFAVKAAVSIGILFPIGFLMGMPMPTGMRVLKSHAPSFVPWMWAINGGFSVLGSVLAVLFSIAYGGSYAMLLGIAAYIVAASVAFTWKQRSKRTEAEEGILEL